MAKEMQFTNKITAKATKKLYLNEETADVYFVFENDGEEQRVAAHKVLLAASSPVFHAMFYGTIKEKGDVKITDSSAKGFTDFLSLFYLEKVKISKANVFEIIDLANKYDIQDGIEMCEQFLLKYTKVHELCTHYGMALKYNLNKLREYCETNIRMCAVQVLNSDGFIDSSKDVLESILKLDDHNCHEMDIFNACIAWAENTCKKNGEDFTEKQNLRQKLGDCFYLVPFTKMSINIFAEIVFVNRTIFTLDEVVDIMAFITKGKSTELTKKFTNHHAIAVETFNWDKDNLVKCIRKIVNNPGTRISKNEFSEFSANKRVLFGGFCFGGFKNMTDSGKNISGIISITKENDNSDELHEKIPFVVYADQKSTASLEIKLNKPIVIIPHTIYKIHVDFTANPIVEDDFVEGWECSGNPFKTFSTIIDGNVCIEFDNDYAIVSQLYFNHL